MLFIIFLSIILLETSAYSKTTLRSQDLLELSIRRYPPHKETMKFMKMPINIYDKKPHNYKFLKFDVEAKNGNSSLGRYLVFDLFGVYQLPALMLISY